MTKRYNVIYRGLSSTRKDVYDLLAPNLFLGHDGIAAFQMALIAIQAPETKEIVESYLAVGYAIDHDGELGNIEFEKLIGRGCFSGNLTLGNIPFEVTNVSVIENWDKIVEKTLSRGRVIENYLELDENGNVFIREPYTTICDVVPCRSPKNYTEMAKCLLENKTYSEPIQIDDKPRCIVKVDRMPLEQYLMEHGNVIGMFNQLKDQYRKAQDRSNKILCERYHI